MTAHPSAGGLRDLTTALGLGAGSGAGSSLSGTAGNPPHGVEKVVAREMRVPLRHAALHGDQCTSADAGGFPIAAMLFPADEVASGAINHSHSLTAIQVTDMEVVRMGATIPLTYDCVRNP